MLAFSNKHPSPPQNFIRVVIALGVLCVSGGLLGPAKAKTRPYRPVFTQALGETAIQPFAFIGSATEWVGAVDFTGTIDDIDSHVGTDVIARIGLRYHTMTALEPMIVAAQCEADVPTGFVTPPLYSMDGLPHSTTLGFRLRRAGLKVGYRDLVHLSGGVSTPQWGLGMLYNNAEERWQPGGWLDLTPREGDRAFRLMAGTGSLTPAKLQFGVGWEIPIVPFTLVESSGRHSILASVTSEFMKNGQAGFMVRLRVDDQSTQTLLGHWLTDAYMRMELPVGAFKLKLGLEVAMENIGSSDSGSSDVQNYAGLFRGELGDETWGLGLHVAMAIDDEQDQSLLMDSNLALGWLAIPYVLKAEAWLQGEPSSKQQSTRNGLSNIYAAKLRARWTPLENLEVLSWLLVAGRPTGQSRAEDWSTVGGELNLGVRWRTLISGTECVLGLDAALLLPSDGYEADDLVLGSRFFLEYRL